MQCQRSYSVTEVFLTNDHGAAVCALRWIAARALKHKNAFCILGIDLSRAFDTIDHAKLLRVLLTVLDEDEIRLIRLLRQDTTLKLRYDHRLVNPFQTNIGTSQGDSLSPVLVMVYLQAALNISPDFLQQMIVYTDDADFICPTTDIVTKIQTEAPAILERWSLKMDPDMTELTTVRRFTTTDRSN